MVLSASPATSIIDTSSLDPATPLPLTALSLSEPVAAPKHISHIPSIFTTHNRELEMARSDRISKESQLRKQATLVEQSARFVVWTSVSDIFYCENVIVTNFDILKHSTAPEVYEEQNIEGWPRYCLTEDVLRLWDLLPPIPRDKFVMLNYSNTSEKWQNVKAPGYWISLVKGQPVLLKTRDVIRCEGISSYLNPTERSKSTIITDRSSIRAQSRMASTPGITRRRRQQSDAWSDDESVLSTPRKPGRRFKRDYGEISDDDCYSHSPRKRARSTCSHDVLSDEELISLTPCHHSQPPLTTVLITPPIPPTSSQFSDEWDFEGFLAASELELTPSTSAFLDTFNFSAEEPIAPLLFPSATAPPTTLLSVAPTSEPHGDILMTDSETSELEIGPLTEVTPTTAIQHEGGFASLPVPHREGCIMPRWPRDFYSVDIGKGFQYLEFSAANTKPVKFRNIFGVSYRRSTYSDHLRRWISANTDARSVAEAHGHTSEGFHSNFMRQVQAVGYDEKIERRRQVTR